MKEGVRWWAQAFDEAGFVGAFRAEVLPAGADPLDIRYNVVNWVNRATRGWSYGQPIDDPRTGEIIKGAVVLGSLRARQDMMIFQALVGARLTGTGDPNDPITATLARLRQLGAHEVGHAIGLRAQFRGEHSGALFGDGLSGAADHARERRAVAQGRLWYRPRAWDRWMIKWLYGARTDADAGRRSPRRDRQGLRFVADQDARTVSAGQPLGALWDDGADPIGELRRMMEVRRVARRAVRHGRAPGRRAACGFAPRVRSDLAARPLSDRGRGQVAGRSRFPLCRER